MLSAIATRPGATDRLEAVASGLSAAERSRIAHAMEIAAEAYAGKLLGTGEPAIDHAIGLAEIIATLRLDAETRAAGLLFALPAFDERADEKIGADFGEAVARLVRGISRVNQLRVVTRSLGAAAGSARASQAEVLRKMLLAMVEDIRVVLLRLASRTQTLRFLTRAPDDQRRGVARETLDIYAPLANRLGVWQLKWELEDLSFRFIEPDTYREIARMLDERRAERERFMREVIAQLERALAAAGIRAQVSGRPKHLYSIWNKMRAKSLEFSQVHDVRAVRVLVEDERDCYAALGVVHDLWQSIAHEFDDYIARPKGNAYRSLHTAVTAPDGRPLEVQIRTQEMHQHAELGVAAHWRYKEGPAGPRDDSFDQRIALLRQMLAWRDDIVGSSDWVEQSRRAALDETVYVLTPQGRVIDLPQGASPIDFAYAVHTDLGHRCRGARVNGALVPLDARLANGDRVEIVAAKTGGPSRDWLNPALGFIRSSRARNKVRQWFNSQALEQTIAAGRAVVEREMQREGRTGTNLEQLARQLGFERSDDFFAALGREEIGTRALQVALRGEPAPARAEPGLSTAQARAAPGAGGVLIVGVDRLMTQLARCCKPVPPDAIAGFVTRGRGVSIHRRGCANLAQLLARFPEREIGADWGAQSGRVFAVDIVVSSADRPGLLRDISEVFSRERVNVTAVNTLSRHGLANMFFTLEVEGLDRLRQTLALVERVPGVDRAARR